MDLDDGKRRGGPITLVWRGLGNAGILRNSTVNRFDMAALGADLWRPWFAAACPFDGRRRLAPDEWPSRPPDGGGIEARHDPRNFDFFNHIFGVHRGFFRVGVDPDSS